MSPNIFKIFLIALIASLYMIAIKPLYTGIGSLWSPEQGITTLKQLNKDYDAILAQSQTLLSQANKMKSDYTKVDASTKEKLVIMVPDTVDAPRLVNEVNTIAQKAGLTLTDLTYSQLSNSDPLRGSYVVSFTVKTTYTRFKELMQLYENSLRLFTVPAVSFSAPLKEGDPTTFQVKLETYYLK